MKFALGPLSGRLRANLPGSKFLAVFPDRSGESEMMLLFHWGIDGFVTTQEWKTELPKRPSSTPGRALVPSEVLAAFVKQMKTLLDRQLLAGPTLTAREQVLHAAFQAPHKQGDAAPVNISGTHGKIHVLQRPQQNSDSETAGASWKCFGQ